MSLSNGLSNRFGFKDSADFRTIEYILEHAEFVSRYEAFAAEEKEVGSHGFVVPCIHRIPFQQALLEYLGEVAPGPDYLGRHSHYL